MPIEKHAIILWEETLSFVEVVGEIKEGFVPGGASQLILPKRFRVRMIDSQDKMER